MRVLGALRPRNFHKISVDAVPYFFLENSRKRLSRDAGSFDAVMLFSPRKLFEFVIPQSDLKCDRVVSNDKGKKKLNLNVWPFRSDTNVLVRVSLALEALLLKYFLILERKLWNVNLSWANIISLTTSEFYKWETMLQINKLIIQISNLVSIAKDFEFFNKFSSVKG